MGRAGVRPRKGGVRVPWGQGGLPGALTRCLQGARGDPEWQGMAGRLGPRILRVDDLGRVPACQWPSVCLAGVSQTSPSLCPAGGQAGGPHPPSPLPRAPCPQLAVPARVGRPRAGASAAPGAPQTQEGLGSDRAPSSPLPSCWSPLCGPSVEGPLCCVWGALPRAGLSPDSPSPRGTLCRPPLPHLPPKRSLRVSSSPWRAAHGPKGSQGVTL